MVKKSDGAYWRSTSWILWFRQRHKHAVSLKRKIMLISDPRKLMNFENALRCRHLFRMTEKRHAMTNRDSCCCQQRRCEVLKYGQPIFYQPSFLWFLYIKIRKKWPYNLAFMSGFLFIYHSYLLWNGLWVQLKGVCVSKAGWFQSSQTTDSFAFSECISFWWCWSSRFSEPSHLI